MDLPTCAKESPLEEATRNTIMTNKSVSRSEILAEAASLGVHLSDSQMEILIPQIHAAAKAMAELDGLELTNVPPASIYVMGDE